MGRLFVGREVMVSKLKYSPAEAAIFLEITLESLESLTTRGKIRQQVYRGKRYYLGGELDAAKLGLNSEEVIKRST